MTTRLAASAATPDVETFERLQENRERERGAIQTTKYYWRSRKCPRGATRGYSNRAKGASTRHFVAPTSKPLAVAASHSTYSVPLRAVPL
jgi:hypothetical protein